MAVPSATLTNEDLERRLDTSDRWIVERTGIRERRIAGAGEDVVTLAMAAGADALKRADVTPDEVGACIVATTTAPQRMPAASASVQDGLGLSGGAFDVNAACAGFVYALVTGFGLVSAGVGPVLVIGSETMSRIVDPEDRATAILFGDGAGALLLSPKDGPSCLLGSDLGCDGSAAALLEVPAGDPYLRMDGSEVFRRAVRVVVSSAAAALERAGLGPEDVDLFVPHQANARILDAIGTRLGIPPERTASNLLRYGNTSAASIPIALCEAADAGRLEDGAVVLLSGFGAGMTWASTVVRWGTR